MHIVVVGAGEVGLYIADRLSKEGHDLALVDINAEKLRKIEEAFDGLTVCGSGTHPKVLEAAKIEHAELLVAVTANDEVNLISSILAKSFKVEQTIVRIEAAELQTPQAKAVRDASEADLFIDPDRETAEEVLDLLDFPGADEVVKMVGDEVVIIGARLSHKAELVGKTLAEIAEESGADWEFMIAAISRDEQAIIPREDHHLIEVGDHVRIVAKRRAREEVLRLLGLDRKPPKRVLLLGGGRTAEILAKGLTARGIQSTIVERNKKRASELAESLPNLRVIEGDITDDEVLEEAEVGRCEMVVALTGEDEDNILACLFAKANHSVMTVAVLHRLALLSLLSGAGVDVALTPRTLTANGVLRFVRGGVAAVATSLHGNVEVLELEVEMGSPADGELIGELDLPKDALVAAFVRDGKSQIGRRYSLLRSHDHVVVVATPDVVEKVHRVFG